VRVCGNGVKPAAGLEPRKPDRLTSHLVGRRADDGVGAVGAFFFFIFKNKKISKIYDGLGIF